MQYGRNIKLFVALLAIFCCLSLRGDDHITVSIYESINDLKLIELEIAQIEDSVKISQLNESEAARKFLQEALDYYQRAEYHLVIESLIVFFSHDWSVVNEHFLTANRLMGKSYYFLKDYRHAFKYYEDYINTFAASNSELTVDVINVMGDLVGLLPKLGLEAQLRVNRVIQLMNSFYSSGELSDQLHYLSAKAWHFVGRKDNAIRIYDGLINETKSNDVKASSMLMSALIDYEKDNLKDAKSKISQAILLGGGIIKGLLLLTLGRIESQLGNHGEAIEYYNNIPPTSAYHEAGLFEGIYSNIESKKFDEAYKQINKYIEKYSGSDSSHKIRNLKFILSVIAGDADKIKNDLNESLSEIINLKRELDYLAEGSRKISISKFIHIYERLKNWIDPGEFAGFLYAEIVRLQKENVSNGNIKTALASLYGKFHFYTAQEKLPRLYNLLKVSHSLFLRHIEVAYLQLDHFESITAKLVLPKQEYTTLERSRKRRTKLLGKLKEVFKTYTYNATQDNLLSGLKSLSESYSSLNISRSQLSSIKNENEYRAAGENREVAVSVLNEELTQSFFDLTRFRVTQIFQEMQGDRIQQLINSIYVHIEDEFSRTVSLLDESPTASKVLLSDANIFWDNWKKVAVKNLKSFKAIRKSIDEISKNWSNKMQTIEEKIALNKKNISEIEGKFSGLIDDQFSNIISIYRMRLGDQVLNHRKWLADAEWIKMMELDADTSSKRDALLSKKQELIESLKDIQFDI